jgi:nuclear protein NHN1
MDKSMDNENITDEQNQSISKESYPAKLRLKERSRSQTTPTNTDINDPENLDYEDIDDNHPVKKINDEVKSSMDIQDEDGEVSNNPPEIDHASSSIPNNPEIASDEGEVDEADLEDGEIHDPSTSKNKNSSLDDQSDRNRNNTGVSSPQAKIHCRYFSQGRCHWGPNCKYIHPNNDSTKNPLGASIDSLSSTNNDISPPTSAGIPMPQTTTNSWISPQATTAPSQFFPNSLLRGQAPPPNLPLGPSTGTESAWERGLRSAKTLREQSMRRKQQDKDFNDKRFNLTIRDALDEKEIDDNVLNIDRPSSIDYDLNDYPDQRAYSDRYHPYRYPDSSSNSHYNNNQRMNNNSRQNNTSSSNDPTDRRTRHSDDYNDNRNRKEKSSIKDSKSTSKRDDSSSYKRNSSQQQYTTGSHHNNDEQLHLNKYGNRKGDDWHDPWDRSRNHSSSNRRPSGGGRGPSYSSSSASSSSSSRSSRSRSHSTSSSSRSRSRSRSRPKRRSPSVTRATTTTKSSEYLKFS